MSLVPHNLRIIRNEVASTSDTFSPRQFPLWIRCDNAVDAPETGMLPYSSSLMIRELLWCIGIKDNLLWGLARSDIVPSVDAGHACFLDALRAVAAESGRLLRDRPPGYLERPPIGMIQRPRPCEQLECSRIDR
jgi:hypothetical protein